MDEAVRIASEFPWARTGCIEVRPVRDVDAVRRRVGACTVRDHADGNPPCPGTRPARTARIPFPAASPRATPHPSFSPPKLACAGAYPPPPPPREEAGQRRKNTG